jgi:protein HIRA/HIR1
MVVIYKPEFVKHDGGSPIFSVDCHPDGTRMATAGGDQKAGVVTRLPLTQFILNSSFSI